MDFFTLFSLGLYGDAVNKYSEPVDIKNEIGSIPRYYDSIYSCNQINNNKTKVFLNASNNFVKSLEPNTNIINKIWRLQKKDRYNKVHIKNDVYNLNKDLINKDLINKGAINKGGINQSAINKGGINQSAINKGAINQNNKSENKQIREHFITDDIQSFFDKIKTYSSLSLICLIILSCLCCCCNF